MKKGVLSGIELLRLDKLGSMIVDNPSPDLKMASMNRLNQAKKKMLSSLKNKSKKWNFAEFYQVSENENELKVRAHIEYSKQIKK